MAWLRNSRFDLSFFILPMVAVLALSPLDHASEKAIAITGLLSLILSAVHIGANWTLLYRDNTFLAFDSRRYGTMGFFIIAGSVLLSLWNLNLFMSVYVYWGLWHFARQHWGIGMLYKARVRNGSRMDYRIDKWCVHLLLFLPLLIQFKRPGEFGFYTITIYRCHLPEALAAWMLALYGGTLIFWLGYALYRFSKKQLNIPAFFTFFSAILSFAVIFFGIEHFLLMYALISIPHSLQYIGLTYHYHRGKNRHLGYDAAKERRFFIKYWVFTVLYVVAAVFFVKINEQLHSPLIYGLLSLTIFHFWVELFSWRAKYNPELHVALH
ncbi:hypothetical protein G3578_00410 [Brevibacillus sp. SYP-B805]|uniref:hypothetical protein n=1 Tax=Brevibacillus sp. SYP-B805 TaxID=1578199 RepID=UPI0013E9EEB7|nr:hypothetical protein [Brevibacillus sp. SYP-B805]NGQ93629.1 hypothetical protein [Brevibacillus sp. SYP-B805]